MDYNIFVNVKIKSVIQTNYELKQQDYGQKLIVSAEDYDINGTTARLFINKIDGTVNERIMTKENDSYTYILDAEDTSCAGKIVADIKYYKQGVRDSSASFIFNIISDRFGKLIESKDFSDSLQKKLDDCDRTIEIISEYDEKIIEINTASARAESAATNSSLVINNCEQATNKANAAADRANTAAATCEGIGENKTGINDNAIGASTTWSSNKINTSLANQIGTASGASINLPNSFNGGLPLKELQGKSVQNGIPSPDAKADIVSVGDDGSVVVKVCGKNLLPNNAKTSTVGEITYTVNPDGTIVAIGTSTSYSAIYPLGNSNDYKSTNLILKNGVTYLNSSGMSIKWRATNGEWGGINNNSKVTPTYDLSIGYVYFEVATVAGTAINLTIKPQLEIGTVATAYEPYKEQLVTIPLTQPLRSVGSVYDRGCVKVNGVWGNERKFKKINTSLLVLSNTMDNVGRRISIADSEIKQSGSIICTHFPFENSSKSSYSSAGNYITAGAKEGTNVIVNIRCDSLRTLITDNSTAVAWASANGLEIYVELATPIFEPYPQVIQDQLNKLQSNAGVTNMFTTDPQQPVIVVSYGKTDTAALSIYASNMNDNKLDKTSVANNLITTVEGTFLDGRQGKALSDKIGNLSGLTTASKTDLVGAVNEVKASVDVVNNNLLNKNKFNSANYSYVYLIGACRTSGKCECVFSFPLTYSTKPTVTVTRSLGFYDRTYGNVPVTIAVTEVGSVIFEVTHSSYVAGSLYSIGAWFSVEGTIL